jgi:putative addiction module component (TIGR02574 family)
MVSPALQAAVRAMTWDERLELLVFIEQSFEDEDTDVELTDEVKEMIRGRDADMDADPTIGVPWDEAKARLTAKWEA